MSNSNRHYSNNHISYVGADSLKVSASPNRFGEIYFSLESAGSVTDFADDYTTEKSHTGFFVSNTFSVTYEQAKQIINALSELVDSHEEAKALAQLDSMRDDDGSISALPVDMEEVEI